MEVRGGQSILSCALSARPVAPAAAMVWPVCLVFRLDHTAVSLASGNRCHMKRHKMVWEMKCVFQLVISLQLKHLLLPNRR